MRAIELLRSEHALIKRAVSRLDRAADAVREGGPVDERLFLKALEFMNAFTHRVHQAKEEILSRLAYGRGLAEAESRPCRDILGFGGAILAVLPEAACGEPAARRMLSENAKAYAALARSNVIGRETLFDAAERSLPEGDDRTLVALFEEAERRLGEGAAVRYGRLVDEIDERSKALAQRCCKPGGNDAGDG